MDEEASVEEAACRFELDGGLNLLASVGLDAVDEDSLLDLDASVADLLRELCAVAVCSFK